jgi:RNA polymerase sigma-70 factor (ECF subfamily)
MADPDLIRRAREGDARAWERVVGEHQEAVFRLAYLLLGDPAEAEDAAQEAFIRAFRSLTRFDADRPLRPWLLRITANLARNRRRSAGRYISALQRALIREPETALGGAPVNPGEGGNPQVLWEAVRRLDPADQEIVYLRFFLDLPVAEAADALDIAPGTVKSRLHRALGRLRELVEREYPALREELTV